MTLVYLQYAINQLEDQKAHNPFRKIAFFQVENCSVGVIVGSLRSLTDNPRTAPPKQGWTFHLGNIGNDKGEKKTANKLTFTKNDLRTPLCISKYIQE